MMRRQIARAAAFASLIYCLLPAHASAQSQITGIVTDTSGAVLPGVTVEAASPALIEKRELLSPTWADAMQSSTCAPVPTA
jgi:hypothetical protein